VITAVAGTKLTSQDTLTNVILKRTPGTSVTVKWVDAYGTTHSSTLKLAVGPPQ
jgi:PDZ domain-containing secreted protein